MTVLAVAAEVLLVTNGLTGVRGPADLGLAPGACRVENTAKAGTVHPFAQMTEAIVDYWTQVPVEQLRRRLGT